MTYEVLSVTVDGEEVPMLRLELGAIPAVEEVYRNCERQLNELTEDDRHHVILRLVKAHIRQERPK